MSWDVAVKPMWLVALVALGSAGTGAALAAGATGPTLTTPQACFLQSYPAVGVPISGSGFAPGATIVLGWQPPTTSGGGGTTAGPTGAFTTTILPGMTTGQQSIPPARVTVVATAPGNPSILASDSFLVGGRGMGVEATAPLLNQRVTWAFGGFAGDTIYAHYLYSHAPVASDRYNSTYRYLGTVAFGRATGPCGSLTTQRTPLGRFHHPSWRSYWEIQFDTSPTFRRDPRSQMLECLIVNAIPGTPSQAQIQPCPYP